MSAAQTQQLRRYLQRWVSIIAMLGLFLAASTMAVQAAGRRQDAGNGETIFKQKCVSCHTVGGGDLVGPDLAGVTERRDLAWIRQFILAPNEVIAANDPIVLDLLSKYNNIPMPNLGLSPQDADDLIAYLGAGGAPVGPAAAPLPGGDPANGERLFNGSSRLAAGGTACIACHSVEGVGALGGGALGPDLTQVYSRYGGEAGLGSVLQTLPFPTMAGIFTTRPLTASEQADLLAFFARADGQGAPRGNQNLWLLLGAGSGLSLLLFGLMLIYWPRQRMSLAQRLRKTGKLS